MSIDIQKLKALAEAAVHQHESWIASGGSWPQPNARLLEMQVAANPTAVLDLIAELKTLRSQVATLQAAPDSWQSGYDEGRKMGTKTALSEREQLKAELADLADLKAYVTIPLRERCAQRQQLQDQNATLRKIISESATACGAAVSVECSVEFMSMLPAEIQSVAGRLREERDSQQRVCIDVIEERDQLKAENERLQRFETAYKEFSDKTDWVRPNAAAHELGMHVADILRKRCDDLTSHNQAQADEIVRLRKVRDRLAADYAALAEDPGSAL